MGLRNALIALLVALPTAATTRAQGWLEVPSPGSSQSGIGAISGWHCSAKRVEIVIDNQPPLLAGSGTMRDDTLGVCGRNDTGFSLLFNWNVLPASCFDCHTHNVRAYADGVEFGNSNFSVAHFGSEFMAGKSGLYTLVNFPSINHYAEIRWEENRQNFSITSTYWYETRFPGQEFLSRRYYGALLSGPQNADCGSQPRDRPALYGSFTISYWDGKMSLATEFADGTSCQFPEIAIEPFESNNIDGYVTARFDRSLTALCPIPGGLKVLSNGRRLVADSMDECKTVHIIGVQG
jgi:hypothetical protein